MRRAARITFGDVAPDALAALALHLLADVFSAFGPNRAHRLAWLWCCGLAAAALLIISHPTRMRASGNQSPPWSGLLRESQRRFSTSKVLSVVRLQAAQLTRLHGHGAPLTTSRLRVHSPQGTCAVLTWSLSRHAPRWRCTTGTTNVTC